MEQTGGATGAGASLPVRDVMGVEVVAVPAADVVAHLARALDEGRRLAVAFLNAHASNVAASQPRFARALDEALVLNDGVGVDLASRRLHGSPFPENLNGTDFVPRLLAELVEPRRLFLLGGRPGVAEAAAEVLAQRAPQHRVVGTRDGYFTDDEAAAVAAEVAASGAEVVLVAMGNPRQELFVAEHGAATGATLLLSVGALLDFLSGRVERAPARVQRWRLEWVYRLALEPGRMWRRYLVGNVRFLLRLARTPRVR
ncbi:WecB/TagA/CpsF family glycosyltransferase [Nocardioides malaquae]|nr:WecB/TagA/CpsF family glycosyltransferase [Nocardioides malaquae]